MTWVCSRSNACSDWLILGHYSPVMPTGRLRACKPYNKQLINFERSVFTGKSQTSALDRDGVEVHKHAKNELGQLSLVNNPYIDNGFPVFRLAVFSMDGIQYNISLLCNTLSKIRCEGKMTHQPICRYSV